MKRRDAIAALMGLPAIGTIAVAALQPHDVIIVECEERLSCAARAAIREQLQGVWPGRSIVVLDRGMRIRFAREEPHT